MATMYNTGNSSQDDVLALSGRPIAVGGVGGSGTRAVAAALLALGVDMGNDLNESLDDLSFNVLFKRRSLWPLAAHAHELESALRYYLNARGLITQDQEDFGLNTEPHWHSELKIYFSGIAGEHHWQNEKWLTTRLKHLLSPQQIDRRWGWKEPNTHVVLPFLLQQLPQLKYVQVVRHGLDMAFSSNQNQLWLWGEAFLQRTVDRTCATDSFDYWCAVHQRLLNIAADFPGRVHLLNFENFCEDPITGLYDLAEFFQLDDTNRQQIKDIGDTVTKPSSCGRYLSQPPLAVTQEQRALRDLGIYVLLVA